MSWEHTERYEEAAVLENMIAGGQVLPAQVATSSTWTAEKKLAAAVFNAGVLARDREWIFSDDIEWPYSFLRLCDLLDLDSDWVRGQVRRWEADGMAPGDGRRFQHAA